MVLAWRPASVTYIKFELQSDQIYFAALQRKYPASVTYIKLELQSNQIYFAALQWK